MSLNNRRPPSRDNGPWTPLCHRGREAQQEFADYFRPHLWEMFLRLHKLCINAWTQYLCQSPEPTKDGFLEFIKDAVKKKRKGFVFKGNYDTAYSFSYYALQEPLKSLLLARAKVIQTHLKDRKKIVEKIDDVCCMHWPFDKYKAEGLVKCAKAYVAANEPPTVNQTFKELIDALDGEERYISMVIISEVTSKR